MSVSCDICGREEIFAVVMLEGAKMVACRGCARGGKIVYRLDEASTDESMPKLFHHKAPFGEEQEIVDNYNILIRKAREQSGLKMEVVAERISEKTSYLESIEHGKLIPTIQVARKLEKELGIKLVETVHEEVISSTTQQKTKFSGATLGDAIPTHKKRKS